MTVSTVARAAALAGVAVLTLGLAGPAFAESTSQTDPADVGGASLTDIRKVTLNHGTEQVITKVRFTDLQETSEAGPSGMTIYFDTRPGRKGPEFRLDTGLQSGTDYQLSRVQGWTSPGEPLSCDHSLRLGWATDVATLRVARTCLGNPAKVRVAVKMVDLYDGSHPVTDWLGNPRSFTDRVAKG
ncbi:hypothetical protein NSZ01_05910 [Nocardioides szechwanensis]|uniref:Secreted protein n=1 Tax=Nocardioides szechwanensis TaxID=1005944 RepID=A0A1G9VUK9_9ACTN|nr:hypothetical protein [Nocardioides szechwanensis]GEP32823.1 hypothetical protein NSZ01_05910 [Nocardioides szechwanensis]SDM75972.1 hypothetical protein SAMN05192576_0871 [Nocardioides szechwanensis]